MFRFRVRFRCEGVRVKRSSQVLVMRLRCERTMWNRSEKVYQLAYKYWCVLQGSGIITNDKKFGPFLVKLQALYTKRCMGLHLHTYGITICPDFYAVTCHI